MTDSEKLGKTLKVIEFYANKTNWGDGIDLNKIINHDRIQEKVFDLNLNSPVINYYGGKEAKNILDEFKNDNKPDYSSFLNIL